jgi:hypothetical protein
MDRVGNDLRKALTGNPNYVNISKYHMQLERYLNVFDRRQIKVVLPDDLRNAAKESVSLVGSSLIKAINKP